MPIDFNEIGIKLNLTSQEVYNTFENDIHDGDIDKYLTSAILLSNDGTQTKYEFTINGVKETIIFANEHFAKGQYGQTHKGIYNDKSVVVKFTDFLDTINMLGFINETIIQTIIYETCIDVGMPDPICPKIYKIFMTDTQIGLIMEEMTNTVENYIMCKKSNHDVKYYIILLMNILNILLRFLYNKLKFNHRDLHANNIMYHMHPFNIKLIDFGFSCINYEGISIRADVFYDTCNAQEGRDMIHSIVDISEHDEIPIVDDLKRGLDKLVKYKSINIPSGKTYNAVADNSLKANNVQIVTSFKINSLHKYPDTNENSTIAKVSNINTWNTTDHDYDTNLLLEIMNFELNTKNLEKYIARLGSDNMKRENILLSLSTYRNPSSDIIIDYMNDKLKAIGSAIDLKNIMQSKISVTTALSRIEGHRLSYALIKVHDVDKYEVEDYVYNFTDYLEEIDYAIDRSLLLCVNKDNGHIREINITERDVMLSDKEIVALFEFSLTNNCSTLHGGNAYNIQYKKYRDRYKLLKANKK